MLPEWPFGESAGSQACAQHHSGSKGPGFESCRKYTTGLVVTSCVCGSDHTLPVSGSPAKPPIQTWFTWLSSAGILTKGAYILRDGGRLLGVAYSLSSYVMSSLAMSVIATAWCCYCYLGFLPNNTKRVATRLYSHPSSTPRRCELSLHDNRS